MAALLLLAPHQSIAAERSVFWGLTADQAGSSVVIVTLQGRRLPRPLVERQELESLTLRLAATELPAGVWEQSLEIPLVPKVLASAQGPDVVIQLLTSAPLVVTQCLGPDGSDTIQIQAQRISSASPLQEELSPESIPLVGTKPGVITLDLRDAEVYDVLRLLATSMGMNLVVSPSVARSTVTVALREVPQDEALEYLVRLCGLSYHRFGQTLMVGPRGELGKVLGKAQFKDYPIAYGDPQKVAAMLRQMTDLGADPDSLVIDERLRTLYVQGTPAQHDEVGRLLRRLDRPDSQVMIKARILEINDNATKEFEAVINAVYDSWWSSFSGDSFYAGAYTSRVNASASISNPAPGGDTVDTTELPGWQNAIWGLAGRGIRMLDAGISAIVQENKGRLLADPTVVVLSGHKAEVKLVDRLKYVSRRDDAGNPTYDDEEVGPQLEIQPVVGRDNLVTVDIRLSTGEISSWLRGSQGEQIPQTTKREVSSKVIVHSGEPFVVGGLFKENRSLTVNRIPVLSDIPLLGALFRSRSGETRRSQVIMIVIPYVLSFPR